MEIWPNRSGFFNMKILGRNGYKTQKSTQDQASYPTCPEEQSNETT